MARKILLQTPVEEPAPIASTAPKAEPSRAPALSGMAKSLAAAAAASVREIDTKLIDESQFRDRLEPDSGSLDDLLSSISARGQLIPILVSPLPNGRFRIVYGRRRLAALRQLGLPAKAFVREMDDEQSILAQGQENSVRRELSWIEKAMFARQLLEAGKSDELVCDALNIDQKARAEGQKLTGLSRMRQVSQRLSPALVESIGPAPSIGRDRWYAFSQAVEKKGFTSGNQDELADMAAADRAAGLDSDTRFQRLETYIARLNRPSAQARNVSGRHGKVSLTPRAATITIRSSDDKALFQWISAHPEAALQALAEARHQAKQPDKEA